MSLQSTYPTIKPVTPNSVFTCRGSAPVHPGHRIWAGHWFLTREGKLAHDVGITTGQPSSVTVARARRLDWVPTNLPNQVELCTPQWIPQYNQGFCTACKRYVPDYIVHTSARHFQESDAGEIQPCGPVIILPTDVHSLGHAAERVRRALSTYFPGQEGDDLFLMCLSGLRNFKDTP